MNMAGTPLDLQILNTLAAVLLLLSFSMLAQRRIVTLVNLLATQGAVLFLATLLLFLGSMIPITLIMLVVVGVWIQSPWNIWK